MSEENRDSVEQLTKSKAQEAEADEELLQLSWPEGQTNVIMFNGCFNPVHIGHVRILEKAVEALESVLCVVVAMAPDSSVRSKLKREGRTLNELASTDDRANMFRLALEENPLKCPFFIDTSQQTCKDGASAMSKRCLQRIEGAAESLQVPVPQMWHLVGPDALHFFGPALSRGTRVVCVFNRRSGIEDANAFLASEDMQPYRDSVKFVDDTDWEHECSSTQVHTAIANDRFENDIPQKVALYIQDQKIYQVSTAASGATSSQVPANKKGWWKKNKEGWRTENKEGWWTPNKEGWWTANKEDWWTAQGPDNTQVIPQMTTDDNPFRELD